MANLGPWWTLNGTLAEHGGGTSAVKIGSGVNADDSYGNSPGALTTNGEAPNSLQFQIPSTYRTGSFAASWLFKDTQSSAHASDSVLFSLCGVWEINTISQVFYYLAGGILQYYDFKGAGNPGTYRWDMNGIWSAGVWNKLAVVFNNSLEDKNRIKLYCNNVEIPYLPPSGPWEGNASGSLNNLAYLDNRLILGSRGDSTSYGVGIGDGYSIGTWDNIVMWDAAISDFSYMDLENPAGAPFAFTTTSPLTSIIKGKTYTVGSPVLTFGAANGTEPYSFARTGGNNWPDGISLESTGELIGTATEKPSPNRAVEVTVTDDTSATAVGTFTAPVTQTTVSTTTLPDGKVNQAYYTTLAVTGGEGPYVWELDESSIDLPDWATLTTGSGPNYNGIISGTPDCECDVDGLVFKATDANDISAVSASMSLLVNPGTGQFEIENSTGTILMSSVRRYVQDTEPTEARPGDEWLNSSNVLKKRKYDDSDWLTVTTS